MGDLHASLACGRTGFGRDDDGRLQSQISAAAGSSVQIVLDGDVTLDQTIQIPAKTAVTITTDGAARTVKRGEGLTAAMFNVPAGSTLTLSGGESRLVLDGASVKASAAMVTSAGMLELTNVDAKNAVNSKTGGRGLSDRGQAQRQRLQLHRQLRQDRRRD